MNLISKIPEQVTQVAPILFVHGAWHGAWCWEEHFMEYFASKGFATYALDLSNHGANQKEKRLNLTSFADYVEDVQEAIASIGEKPILIGHSMGGGVVQKFLEKDSCHAAVLLATLPISGALGVTLKILKNHPLTFLSSNLTLDLYKIIQTRERTKWAFYEENIADDLLAKYNEKLQGESYRAFLDMLFFRVKINHHKSTPMLIVAGEKDQIFTLEEEERTAKYYNADYKIIADAPHNLMLVSHWRETADLVLEWLETASK